MGRCPYVRSSKTPGTHNVQAVWPSWAARVAHPPMCCGEGCQPQGRRPGPAVRHSRRRRLPPCRREPDSTPRGVSSSISRTAPPHASTPGGGGRSSAPLGRIQVACASGRQISARSAGGPSLRAGWGVPLSGPTRRQYHERATVPAVDATDVTRRAARRLASMSGAWRGISALGFLGVPLPVQLSTAHSRRIGPRSQRSRRRLPDLCDFAAIRGFLGFLHVSQQLPVAAELTHRVGAEFACPVLFGPCSSRVFLGLPKPDLHAQHAPGPGTERSSQVGFELGSCRRCGAADSVCGSLSGDLCCGHRGVLRSGARAEHPLRAVGSIRRCEQAGAKCTVHSGSGNAPLEPARELGLAVDGERPYDMHCVGPASFPSEVRAHSWVAGRTRPTSGQLHLTSPPIGVVQPRFGEFRQTELAQLGPTGVGHHRPQSGGLRTPSLAQISGRPCQSVAPRRSTSFRCLPILTETGSDLTNSGPTRSSTPFNILSHPGQRNDGICSEVLSTPASCVLLEVSLRSFSSRLRIEVAGANPAACASAEPASPSSALYLCVHCGLPSADLYQEVGQEPALQQRCRRARQGSSKRLSTL